MRIKKQNIYFNVLVWTIILFVFILFGMNILKARFPHGKITREINPEKPMAAFTFDDGVNANFTIEILEILYENQATATFFINGNNIRSNEALVKKVVGEGHELANHTFQHHDLTTLTHDEVVLEVEKTQSEVERVIPGYLLKYVRPPYGRYNDEVLEAISQPLVLWDLDSGDWTAPDADKIYSQVMENVKDGDIVIFHDDNAETVEAIARIIPELKKTEMQLVTLSELDSYRQIKPVK